MVLEAWMLRPAGTILSIQCDHLHHTDQRALPRELLNEPASFIKKDTIFISRQ